MPNRYRMTLAYDGTAYAGWQVQPGNVTIQGEVERSLHEVTGESPRVHCSGRTDSGVHARAQVAHFDLDRPAAQRRLLHALNAILADDIRIRALAPCAPDFDARRGATGKQYRYFIYDGPVLPPFVRRYRLHCRRRLDSDAMREAAALLVGRHDFAAFAANPNRDVPSTVRTITTLDVRRHGHELTIRAEGDGFLYKMVRSLAGFLVRVGQAELPPAAATAILTSRERTARVPSAPPQGLFLWEVYYPPTRAPTAAEQRGQRPQPKVSEGDGR
jgi:tRNA pseudouridine38-40 synthase